MFRHRRSAQVQTNNSDDSINEINITPFVDVVLVLLVIFMVTAPMIAKKVIQVQLPKAAKSDDQTGAFLGISVIKSGQILLNGELLTDEAFLNNVKIEMQKNPKIEALISGDLEATHGSVVKVMGLLKSIGLENFSLQVIKE